MSDDQRFEQFYTLCKKHIERGHVLDVRQLDTLAEWVQNWSSVWSRPIEDRPAESDPVLDELQQAILDVLGDQSRVDHGWMSAADIVRYLLRKGNSASRYRACDIERLLPADVVDAIQRMRKADSVLDDRIEEAIDRCAFRCAYRLRD